MQKLIRNRIRCNHCGAEIESKHTHDFVTCPCGKCSVDGGLEYCRIVANKGDFTDLTEYEEISDNHN